MTNYLYNILLINAPTDQLVRRLRFTTVILMRCRFPGVGSNPRNGYMFVIVIILFFYLFFFFFFLLLSTVVVFLVFHVHFYLFSNLSVNHTPFWYHSFKKPKLFRFFVDYLFFVFTDTCTVRLVSIQ